MKSPEKRAIVSAIEATAISIEIEVITIQVARDHNLKNISAGEDGQWPDLNRRNGKRPIPGLPIEKRARPKPAQVPTPQRLARFLGNLSQCLTEKKGLFSGRFAEKRGFQGNYFTLFFAFCLFFGIFSGASRWP